MKTTQSQVEANERKVKAQLLESQIDDRGWNYCQGCDRSDRPLHLSHNRNKGAGGSKELITVDDAKIQCDICHSAKHHLKIVESKPMWGEK